MKASKKKKKQHGPLSKWNTFMFTTHYLLQAELNQEMSVGSSLTLLTLRKCIISSPDGLGCNFRYISKVFGGKATISQTPNPLRSEVEGKCKDEEILIQDGTQVNHR